jgi:predicted nucleotidyltransferase component of viral defense system
MILKKEIEKKAIEHNVSRNTIDKDWVLGHFIDAIFSVEKCKKELVFKGGTCLRKCYINNYRFSEDLDFTSIDSGFVLDDNLLTDVVELVTKKAEIPLHIDRLTQLKHNGKPTGYSAIMKFWGADHSKDQAPPVAQRWTTSIKIEIIQYEKMIFPIVNRPVTHEYSDKLSSAVNAIPCYDLMEVLSEKLRALIQRSYTAPRDYYDIWYLANYIADLDWSAITKAFYEKMKFKNIEFTGIEQLINSENPKDFRPYFIHFV